MTSRTAIHALLKLMLLLLATINISSAAPAADPTDAAKKLMDRAIAKVLAVGRDAAAKDFVTSSEWRQGATYIVMNDFQGTVLAHSANPKMVGKVMFNAKDATGKLFVQECIHNLKARGVSVVDLKWGSPVTKKIAPAQMHSKRVPDQELYISVLVFK